MGINLGPAFDPTPEMLAVYEARYTALNERHQQYHARDNPYDPLPGETREQARQRAQAEHDSYMLDRAICAELDTSDCLIAKIDKLFADYHAGKPMLSVAPTGLSVPGSWPEAPPPERNSVPPSNGVIVIPIPNQPPRVIPVLHEASGQSSVALCDMVDSTAQLLREMMMRAEDGKAEEESKAPQPVRRRPPAPMGRRPPYPMERRDVL